MDYVIIVAGGKGIRMGGEVPKQFLPIGGLPVLMHTLRRFREYSAELNIILVLPRAQQDYWRNLCRQHQFNIPHTIADGGRTRFHSVQSGLALIPDDAQGVVGVHDGVRPFVALDVIRLCYATARTVGAAVPVVPVVESLRHLDHPTATDCVAGTDAVGNATSVAVDRSRYRLVQTPQTFDIALLKAANRQPWRDTFTDDASVVETYGHSITLVDGNRENIKITTPFDLAIAETLCRQESWK